MNLAINNYASVSNNFVAGKSPFKTATAPSTLEPKILVLHRDEDSDELLRSIGRDNQSAFVRIAGLEAARQQADELAWGCLVVDRVANPGELAEFVHRFPSFPVIVWAPQLDTRTAVEMMKWGIADVLRKPSDDDMLAASIQRAIRLGRERMVAALQRRDVLQRFSELSGHERTVLSLVFQGHTNKQIASQMDCSLRTIEARRQRILKVMRAENAIELAVILTRQGLIGDLQNHAVNLRVLSDSNVD